MGTIPDAIAAAEPPLEPPALYSRFQGFVGRTEKPGLGRRRQAKLGGTSLAEDNEAGLLEAHDYFGVLIGDELAKSAATKGGDCAGI